MHLVIIPLADAQQAQKIPRIGFLQRRAAPTVANPDPLAGAFLQGLRDLGYIDGKNIKIEHRRAARKTEQLPQFIAEFLKLKVDVIVVPGNPAIRAAREATKTTPIVIVTQSYPVAENFVDSLACPGGNITGLTRLTSELSGKRLELFKEAIPALKRVGILVGGSELRGTLEHYEAAARAFRVTLHPVSLEVSMASFDQAFQTTAKENVNALIVNRDVITASLLKQIADLAIRHRLPSMNEDSSYVEAGGLMSYATNDAEQFKRGAYYVDKMILKGTKPADFPVEQATKFEFVVNLKTANQIGLTIPPNVLVRADRVIR